MKKEILMQLFAKVQTLFENLVDTAKDYRPYHGENAKKMTEEDAGIFTTLMFYSFAMSLASFIIALPIMTLMKYPAVGILLMFALIGLAFPATIMVATCKFYWVFSYNISLFFERYSVPQVGQTKNTRMLCKLQRKMFRPLLISSIGILICYITYKATADGTLQLMNIGLGILLPAISWIGAGIMAADGICICAVFGYEIFLKLFKYKAPKHLKRSDIETVKTSIKTTFTKKQKYIPKRLAVKSTSRSEKIFSLKNLARELLANPLNA